jgi:hypothetical protein
MDPEPLHILLERASSSSERDEENRGPSLVLTGVLLLTIATLVVSGRIYCRAVLIRRMGPDDWCMIFATVCPFRRTGGKGNWRLWVLM